MHRHWLGLAIALTGCSKATAVHCPSADEILRVTGGSAVERDEAVITSERCAADHWSAASVACVRGAHGDDIEACFKQLTDGQRMALKAALKSASAAHAPIRDDQRAVDLAGMQASLDKALGDAAITAVFASSSECTHYEVSISATFKAVAACPNLDLLEIYGAQQETLAEVKRIVTLPEAERAAACSHADAVVTEQPLATCHSAN